MEVDAKARTSAEMTPSSRLPRFAIIRREHRRYAASCRRKSWASSRPSSAACAIAVAYRLNSMAQSSIADTGATMPFRYENGSFNLSGLGGPATELKIISWMIP